MSIDAAGARERLAAVVGDSLDVGELLGTGGFGAVFRAHDPLLERDVAIKVLDPDLGLTGELEAQFLHEARAVAGVEHPHIVPLYAAESKEGLLYLVMRLLPGPSLAKRIESSGPMPSDEIARLGHEVAMALATAHERGVVHRDIKPENILLDGAGHATVTDFGISLVTSRPSSEGGSTAGTPHYMSPEQALGENVDGRADVYSLGVMLFRMLTGRFPFDAGNLTELIHRQLTTTAPKVSSLRTDTPVALATLVDRMLTKERDARPDATEVVRSFAAARTPDALLTPAQANRKRWRRRMTLVSVAVVAGGTVLAGVIYMVSQIAMAFLNSDAGAPPRLHAFGTGIPDSVVAAARADGLLKADEEVRYAFIPAGASMADALLMTDSALIRRAPGAGRRIVLDQGDLRINRLAGGGMIRGTVIWRLGDQPPDTIYDNLSGLESSALLAAVQQVTRQVEGARTP
jgi:serine/threonine-protein kinase